MRRLVGPLLALGIAAGLSACITPSIPIPPPAPENMMFHLTTVDTATTAVMTYPADDLYKGGVAYVYDETNGQGVIENVNPDGSVGPTPAFPAQLGDQIVFTIQNGEQTVSTCVVLREGAQDPTVYCTP